MEKEAFRDCVLRSLPDMKTVIALHHNLLKAEDLGGRQAVAGGNEVPPELQLRSEGVCRGCAALDSEPAWTNEGRWKGFQLWTTQLGA